MSQGLALQPMYRVTVFVPPAHLQAVVDGICAADSLTLGDYSEVVWTSAPGTEQFRPLPGARPAQGEIGALERAATVRIEFCIPRDAQRLARIVNNGIRAFHPWEIPAIFVDETGVPLP